MTSRSATISRDTLETQVVAAIDIDGTGNASFDTGVPFWEHMLGQIACRSLIDLDVKAKDVMAEEGIHVRFSKV